MKKVMIITLNLFLLTSCIDVTPNPGNVAPSALNVTISHDGSPYAGETISGSYTFSDPDGDSEGLSIYKWYSKPGYFDEFYTVIEGENDLSFIPGEAMYVKFSVTPVDERGKEGEEVFSDYIVINGGT